MRCKSYSGIRTFERGPRKFSIDALIFFHNYSRVEHAPDTQQPLMEVIMPDSILYSWIVLPAIICFARIIDVSIGTLRLILISKGYRLWAPLLGFLEVLVWVTAIVQIMKNLNNPACYLGYATGFALGNYLGMWLEEKLSLGTVMIRIVTQKDASRLISYLAQRKIGVTTVAAEGAFAPVKVIFTIANRTELSEILNKIKEFNPNAFYSVEDIRFVSEGVFPAKTPLHRRAYQFMSRHRRKGK